MNGGPTLINGPGGAGKSTAALSYALKNFKKSEILFVVPQHEQCKKPKSDGYEAITFHKFAAQNQDGSRSWRTPYNYAKKYKLVIFDEAFSLSLMQLTYLDKIFRVEAKLKEEGKPYVQFVAAGDEFQIGPIHDQGIDCQRRKEYLTSEGLFHRTLRLTVYKRVCEEDRAEFTRLAEFIKDGRNKMGSIRRFLRRELPSAFIQLEDLRRRRIMVGLSFLNDSRDTLNALVHSYFPHSLHQAHHAVDLGHGITYHFHGELVYKVPEGAEKEAEEEIEEAKVEDEEFTPPLPRFTQNGTYKIETMSQDCYTLKDKGGSGDELSVPTSRIISHFSLPYVRTVHSAQGDAIKEPFFIVDINKGFTREWLYTAFTRLVRLKDLYFLDEDLKLDNELQAAAKMISGYKLQDKLNAAKGRIPLPRQDEYHNPEQCSSRSNANASAPVERTCA